MPKKFKWEIKGLSEDNSLKESAKLILKQKLKVLNSTVKTFFDEETVENLHSVRIALRRVRYNMELFIACFDKDKFIAFYQLVEHLQDLTGAKRDLDVLAENIKKYSGEGKNTATDIFLKQVVEKNKLLEESLTLELMKFTHSNELKDFKKMLK